MNNSDNSSLSIGQYADEMLKNVNLSDPHLRIPVTIHLLSSVWLICASKFILGTIKNHATLRGSKFLLLRIENTLNVTLGALRVWLFLLLFLTDIPRNNSFDFYAVKIATFTIRSLFCCSVIFLLGMLAFQYIGSKYPDIEQVICEKKIKIISMIGTALVIVFQFFVHIFESQEISFAIFMILASMLSMSVCGRMRHDRYRVQMEGLNVTPCSIA